MHIKEIIADRLIEARNAKRWTQTELGRRSGVAANNICRYEQSARQQMDVGNLLALSDALGISLDWLFGRESKAYQNPYTAPAVYVHEPATRQLKEKESLMIAQIAS